MKNILHSKLKYLFIFPIVLVNGFSLFFGYVNGERQREVINEKMIEKRTEVEIIIAQVDRYVELDKDWGTYNYASDISYVVEKLDRMYGVFAAVYDDKFRLVSKRELSGESADQSDNLFDPVQSSDFIIKAQYNNNGNLELPYDRGRDEVIMHTYFQWVPTKPTYERRLLVVIGITPDSAQTHPENFMTIGMVGLIAVTFLLNLGLVIMISRLKRNKEPLESGTGETL
jgi:hypothetical protein